MSKAEKAVRYEAIEVQKSFKRESGEVVPAYWAVCESSTRLRVRYGSQEKMEAATTRWNANPQLVPSAIQSKVDSAQYLLSILKPGDEVKTILRHVSRSGMMRHISLIFNDHEISGYAADLLDDKRADDGGIKVGGCGMDMGFDLVYRLSSVLFPEGFTCIGDRCPSSDHSNGDRNYKPHHHNSGGYALRQRWL